MTADAYVILEGEVRGDEVLIRAHDVDCPAEGDCGCSRDVFATVSLTPKEIRQCYPGL